MSSPYRILFLCHGNICRSPTAQFVMQDLVDRAGLAETFFIDSAAVSSEEIGNDIYPPAQKQLRAHSIPFEKRGAWRITAADRDKWDLFVCMDANNVWRAEAILGSEAPIHLLLEYTGENRDLADPWYTHDYETAFEEISRGCVALLECLREQLGR